ncbi:MAG: YciI family protein [Acidimicrobiia bacterium]
MAQYLLSVWHDDEYAVELDSDEMQRIGAQVEAFNQSVQEAGAWVFANGLQPASTATVVRAAGSEVSITDGPYAETKEQMGGFWVVDVPDLDAALEWARRGARACELPVEVRPMQDG